MKKLLLTIVALITVAMIVIFIVAIFRIPSIFKPSAEEIKRDSINNVILNSPPFELGKKYFEDGKIEDAKMYFCKVDKDDANFDSARIYIKKCEGAAAEKFAQENKIKEEKEKIKKEQRVAKQKEADDIEKKKAVLEKKYKRIFEGSGYISQKKAKLMQYDFAQTKSGYEKAPDGSQQVAMYYSKKEDGFKINVRLQYSYSLEYHYSKVGV